MKLELVATCLFGLEKLLGEEIDALGYKRIETMDGRITYEGDERAVFVSNLNLRFAERVFIKLGAFKAESFLDITNGRRISVFSYRFGNVFVNAPFSFLHRLHIILLKKKHLFFVFIIT